MTAKKDCFIFYKYIEWVDIRNPSSLLLKKRYLFLNLQNHINVIFFIKSFIIFHIFKKGIIRFLLKNLNHGFIIFLY